MSRSLGFRPSHTQLVAAFLSVASVGIASVTACSKESKSSEAPSTPVFPSFFAADVGSLPACVAERGGALAYTSGDKKFRSCANGEWAEIDMAQLQGAVGAAGAAGAKGDAGVSVVGNIIEPGEDCTFGGLSLKVGSEEFITCNSHPADMDILSGVTLVAPVAAGGGDAESISLPVSVDLVGSSVDELSVAVEKIGTPGSVCDDASWNAGSQSIVCVKNAGFDASAQTGDAYFVTLRSVKLEVQDGEAEAFPVMGRVFVLDNSAPAVSSTGPADAASVAVSPTEITVTFNEPVDPDTINLVSLKSDKADAPELCKYWSLNKAGTVVTCKGLDGDNNSDNLNLAEGTYTIAVSGVKDVAGNDMAEFTSTTFTVDSTKPVLAETGPVASTTAALTIKFSENILNALADDAALKAAITACTYTPVDDPTTDVCDLAVLAENDTVAILDDTITVMFDPAKTAGDKIRFAIAADAVKDVAGNKNLAIEIESDDAVEIIGAL